MDDLLSRITMNPEICHGKPVIRNMRYPVETLLKVLSSGMTIEELLVDYPDLEREDLLAPLTYAPLLSQVKRIQDSSMKFLVDAQFPWRLAHAINLPRLR